MADQELQTPLLPASAATAVAPLRVAIIGAGPAGLVLAAALGKRGGDFEVDVFDQAPDHASAPEFNPNRSYTIDITGHGAKALRYLGPEAEAVFDEHLLAFRGLNLICVEDKVHMPEGNRGWTGSRGTICQTLQKLSQDRNNVKICFDCRVEVLDFDSGEVLVNSGEVPVHSDHAVRRQYDVVVAADGGGSAARTAMFEPDQVKSTNNGNLSIMLAFDRKELLGELDPCVLYGMSLRPALCVAGAINGPGGKEDPLWFCQVGVKGEEAATRMQNMTLPDLRKFIGPRPSRYCTDDELKQFQMRQPQSTGKAKVCPSWVRGRCVLLGDAAAPFPPVGQGVNAAMESATVLDACLSTCKSGSAENVAAALAQFEQLWRPEADAVTRIACENDVMAMTFPQIVFKHALQLINAQALHNSKQGELPYDSALTREKKATWTVVASVAVVFVAVVISSVLFGLR